MLVTTETLTAIVQSGGGFEIDALCHDPTVLATFIGGADTTAAIRIRNAWAWPPEQLASLARTAPPGVVQYVF